jgi:ABC-2 type transport system ATP-binding protein
MMETDSRNGAGSSAAIGGSGATAGSGAAAGAGQESLPAAFRGESLRKDFGKGPVLNGLDFLVPQGAAVGLLGANASGKTTLLKILLGLLAPDSGRASVIGQRVETLTPELRARIGYVPQWPSQFAWLTVESMLSYIAAFYPKFDDQYAKSLVGRWQIPVKTHISALSPGLQQRLSIVRALAPQPDLIVLDEPIASVDPLTRIAVIDELQRLRREHAVTLVFSSHIIGDLRRLCSDFAIVAGGKISVMAPVEEFAGLERVIVEGPENVLLTFDFTSCQRVRKSGEGERALLLRAAHVESWLSTLPPSLRVKSRDQDLEMAVSEWMR